MTTGRKYKTQKTQKNTKHRKKRKTADFNESTQLLQGRKTKLCKASNKLKVLQNC